MVSSKLLSRVNHWEFVKQSDASIRSIKTIICIDYLQKLITVYLITWVHLLANDVTYNDHDHLLISQINR